MKGTEKQIKWAESIKAGVMPLISKHIESFRAKAKGTSEEELINVTCDKIVAVLEEKDAGWWIDHRPKLEGNHQAAFEAIWPEVAQEAAKA